MEGTNSIQLHGHYLIMTVCIAQTTEEQIKVGKAQILDFVLFRMKFMHNSHRNMCFTVLWK